MTDEAALLRACEAAPADDTPALVYADWLDDHGDTDRAEFIRVQCELANGGPSGVGVKETIAANIRVRARERELLAAHWRGWVRPDPGYVSASWPAVVGGQTTNVEVDGVVYTFRRGFVAELRVPTLGVLLGEECGRCGGEGRVESPNPAFTRRCPACEGTPGGDDYRCSGRTPGLVKQVFTQHPVTRAVVGDLQPLEVWDGTWAWFHYSPGATDASDLPREVFDRLAGYYRKGDLVGHPDMESRHYHTRAAAIDALSRALVDHCRGLVGLAPIYATAPPSPPEA